MLISYEQIIKLPTEEIKKHFDFIRFKLWLSKENKHFHFVYRYQKDELDTDKKIQKVDKKLCDCTNNNYEEISEDDFDFNDVYNPASCFIYKDRFMADIIVLYQDKKQKILK